MKLLTISLTRLRQYLPEDDTRLALKNCYRQYQQAVAIRTMLKNNLISSLDLTFPDANKLFSSPAKNNGCEKWVDFIGDFWHSECVSSLSPDAFSKKYLKWCQKHGYNFTRSKSDENSSVTRALQYFFNLFELWTSFVFCMQHSKRRHLFPTCSDIICCFSVIYLIVRRAK